MTEHRPHKDLDNRAKNSHHPTRRRERVRKGFRSAGGAQQFPSAFGSIPPHVQTRHPLMTAAHRRAETAFRITIGDQITGATALPTAARPRHPPAPPRPDLHQPISTPPT
ncbi:hypothetical protein [Streptomyces thermolineatus]|uniref:hypothetical protein n=1 Tax=Streptomyces thermolineatus TaxID=44033 RepID=UPI00384D7FFF